MVSKDQGIGGAILAVCVIVAVAFLVLVIDPGLITSHSGNDVRLYAVVVLVTIAFIAILAIGAWIGWTMATTPPPKPIEEITTEIEEKKEEPKADEAKTDDASTTDTTTKKKK